MSDSTRSFLDVRDLTVSFPTEGGLVHAVEGVSFSIERGETLAIVGESGSGKSVSAQAIMGLINRKAAQISGEVWVNGKDIVAMSDDDVRKMRGCVMALILQDPMSCIHALYKIGAQLSEAVRVHQQVSKADAKAQAVDMLGRVGIPDPKSRADTYPHQLSGGMRQRVMIAMALINSPSLLIADEPTTALDVTVQAQILELIASLQQEFDTAVVLITHDLGIVADVADNVAVMYGGRLVERANVDDIFYRAQMPYTLGLLSSVPRLDQVTSDRLDPIPGNPPSPINLPPGCVFQPRCSYSHLVGGTTCEMKRPELLQINADHFVRCHLDEAERVRISTEVTHVLHGGGA